MAVPNVFLPNAVVFPSGNPLRQIEGIPISPGFDPLVVIPTGSTFPGFSGYNFTDPTIGISTTQILDLLTYLSVENICSGAIDTNLDVQYQKLGNVNVRVDQADFAHLRVRAGGHLTVLNSVGADAGGVATADFTVHAISNDGTTPPLERTGSSPITGSPVVQELYGLGPVDVDGTDICVDSWRLDTNVDVRKKQCSGGNHMEFAGVVTSRPTLTVTTDDVDLVMSYNETGDAFTTVTFGLRQRVAGGINIAAGTASHILFTATAGSIHASGTREIMFNINSWARNLSSALT